MDRADKAGIEGGENDEEGEGLLGGSDPYGGIGAAGAAATTVEFWHAMSGELGERVKELVKKFNKSQNGYGVKAVGKGSYDEVVNGTIAAYRAKRQPEIVQSNGRAFLTMVNSGATVPTAELMRSRATRSTGRSSSPRSAPTTRRRPAQDDAVQLLDADPLLQHATTSKRRASTGPAATWQELEAQLYAIKSQGRREMRMVYPGD